MITIITEKPSIGMAIAREVGATRKRGGYMEGGGYFVTWAFGHLLQLALPSHYGHTRPERDTLPFVPQSFIRIVRQRKGAKEYETDPGAARQLSVIGKLLARSRAVIAATDAGREGELIFRYIYQHCACTLPVSRLWISSLTGQAIRQGLEHLQDGSRYDTLYHAAECRAQADWLVGINASQALAVASGLPNHSLGRVQTPTLALICARYRENRTFTPSDYWELYAVLSGGGALRKFRYTATLTDPVLARQAHERAAAAPFALITRSESIPSREAPPLLYDLTSLQKECNVRHDMSPEQTLEAAQTLYEHKLITYPRTGSRYIPDDLFPSVPALLRKALSLPAFAHLKGYDLSEPNTRCVDGAKVSDHHALLTTGHIPQELSQSEEAVYRLIAARMLEAFGPDCHKQTLVMQASIAGDEYISRSVTVTSPGWRAVRAEADTPQSDSGPEGEGEAVFPAGEQATVAGCSLAAKKTRPRPLHTEATLLSAMELAGREVGEGDAREAMTACGLGTPATRAAIIATLFRREYITPKGKSLVPTEKGLFVYEAVKDMRIADPQLTGEWEAALARIERGDAAPADFMEAIRGFTGEVTREVLSLRLLDPPGTITCPRCRAGRVTLRPGAASCDAPGCGLVLYRQMLGIRLTDDHLRVLLSGGVTRTIKGLIGKAGKSFDARLTLDEQFSVVIAKEEKGAERKGRGRAKKLPATTLPATTRKG